MTTLQELVKEFQRHHGSSVAGVIEAGKVLIRVKKNTKFGHYLPLVEALGISNTTAQRYIKVAKDPRLSNAAIWPHLPQGLRILYEISKLKDPQFQQGLATNQITPHMEHKDVERLRRGEQKPSPPPEGPTKTIQTPLSRGERWLLAAFLENALSEMEPDDLAFMVVKYTEKHTIHDLDPAGLKPKQLLKKLRKGLR
ncbi:MAG: hypothetical protein HQL52_03800 [Magnetococcales bacterium]|nr:hypothetical protein [Magnetococcales bacterium]